MATKKNAKAKPGKTAAKKAPAKKTSAKKDVRPSLKKIAKPAAKKAALKSSLKKKGASAKTAGMDRAKNPVKKSVKSKSAPKKPVKSAAKRPQAKAPAKKSVKPTSKKAVPVKSKVAAKKATAKPAAKKAAKPTSKAPVKKAASKKPVQKAAPKKPAKKAVKVVPKKAMKTVPQKTIKVLSKMHPKEGGKTAAKPVGRISLKKGKASAPKKAAPQKQAAAKKAAPSKPARQASPSKAGGKPAPKKPAPSAKAGGKGTAPTVGSTIKNIIHKVTDVVSHALGNDKGKSSAGKKNVQQKAPARNKTAENAVNREVESQRRNLTDNKMTKNTSGPNVKKQPEPFKSQDTGRTRYTDAELQEFREIINKKLEEARKDLDLLKESLSNKDNGTDDTSPTFKLLEDGSDVLTKEETAQLAARQQKFIQNLENALMRIENKTYGICRVTGKLIPKERLRVVPHATLSIEAKNVQ